MNKKLVVWGLVFLCIGLQAKKEKPHKNKDMPQSGILTFSPHFKKVKIDIEKGDISVDVAEPGEKAMVTYEQKSVAKQYSFFCEVQDDVLIVKFKKRSSWLKFFTPTSTINLIIKVPRNIDVSAHAGLGFFTLNGITGALDCDYGSGTIFVTASSSSMALKLGTGDIIIDYPGMPRKLCPIAMTGGIVKAKVTLPSHAFVQAKYDNSSLFEFNNEFAEVKNAKQCNFKVTIAAGTGSLEIKKQS